MCGREKRTGQCCILSAKNRMPVEKSAERLFELGNSILLLPECLYQWLQFLVDTDNDSVKKKIDIFLIAGELVGKLWPNTKEIQEPWQPWNSQKTEYALCTTSKIMMFGKYLQRKNGCEKCVWFANFPRKSILKNLIDMVS